MAKRKTKLKEIQNLTGQDGVTTHEERVEFAKTFSSLLRPEIPPPIVQWTEDNIDLALDKDSAYKGKLVLRPWQREVLAEYEKETTEEVVVMSCSRAGKSILAIATTLYNLRW